jgi:argininosuccinate lyase
LAGLREDLVSLADAYAMTLMPASIAGRPAQPTMFGHFLGGAIAPLGPAATRLAAAMQEMDRSPLGAGLLAGEMIAIDRERVARALGFRLPIPYTFDAVANIEDFVAILEGLAAGLAPVTRLLREFAAWIRASPNSLVLTDDWERHPEPTVPTLIVGDRLSTLIDGLEERLRQVTSGIVRLRGVDYAPLGAAHAVTRVLGSDLVIDCGNAIADVRDFLANGVLINRAYLGNRAGRGYTTAGDLAAFLMSEEQLPPAAARAIASIVAGKLQEHTLETSAVTQEMIDSAALLLIGREIKVEIEALGRSLAPRRFIERRQVTGSPAAEQLRAWLAEERRVLDDVQPSSRGAEALAAIRTDIATLADTP